jgi:SMODS and SLOG-associating 2TM effector domain 1/Protein of unknown function (DUF4231)
MNVGSDVVEGAWRRQRQWSLAASTGRVRLERWRRVNLILLVAGAILGAVAAQSSWPRGVTGIAAGGAALALAVAGILQQRFLNPDEVARWTGARAAAETLKAEVYRYRAGVAPYHDAARDSTLSAQLAAIQNKAAALALDLQQTRADDRALPEVSDFRSYVEQRARQQADWHRGKIAGHVQAARRIRLAELAATAVAAVLGAIAAALDTKGLAIWIGVATTIGAALAAHASATQRDRIAAGYAATADRLDLLIERLPADPDAATRAQFVAEVESTLAAQNETWLGLLAPKPA